MTRQLKRGMSQFHQFGSHFRTSSHEEIHGTRTVLYSRPGLLAATNGQDLTFPRGSQIISWWMNLQTGPTTGAFTCDATVDGISIFGTDPLPRIETGLKEMDKVTVIGSRKALISDSQTLVILPVLLNGLPAGLHVWLEMDLGESDD